MVKFAHQLQNALRYILIILVLTTGVFTARGQEIIPADSAVAISDTSRIAVTAKSTIHTDTTIVKDSTRRKKVFEPNAKKSGMYSSILPGLGQIYNRQYWKVPVVYAILGTAGYFIGYNYNKYTEYRQAYIYAIDGDPGTSDELSRFYDAQSLQRLQNNYKKDLDVIVLLTSVGYALQIMDAVASAHLKNFDVSRDISMQVKPMVQNNFVGMGLVMNFK